MAVAPVKIEGWQELKKALAELPKGTARNVQQRVLTKNARPIAEAAQQLAPKDTGRLSSGIVVTTKRPRGYKTPAARAFAKTIGTGGSQAEARAAAKTAGSAPVVVFVVTPAGPGRLHVDLWQEFGTKFAPPHPYMRPAVDRLRGQVFQNIGRDMWAEIKKSAERLAKKRAKAAGR